MEKTTHKETEASLIQKNLNKAQFYSDDFYISSVIITTFNPPKTNNAECTSLKTSLPFFDDSGTNWQLQYDFNPDKTYHAKVIWSFF